ncbi:MAG: hypothetical protein ACREBU_06760 [Nitrososphaera sp.]
MPAFISIVRILLEVFYPGRPFPNEAVLWKALDETLKLFGNVFRSAIIHDLNSMNRDNTAHGPSHLDVGMISESLRRHFSLDAYELIMNRMLAKLHELESVSVAA